MQNDERAPEYPPIETRSEGSTAWSTALPLLLIGLLALMVLHSCMRA